MIIDYKEITNKTFKESKHLTPSKQRRMASESMVKKLLHIIT